MQVMKEGPDPSIPYFSADKPRAYMILFRFSVGLSVVSCPSLCGFYTVCTTTHRHGQKEGLKDHTNKQVSMGEVEHTSQTYQNDNDAIVVFLK